MSLKVQVGLLTISTINQYQAVLSCLNWGWDGRPKIGYLYPSLPKQKSTCSRSYCYLSHCRNYIGHTFTYCSPLPFSHTLWSLMPETPTRQEWKRFWHQGARHFTRCHTWKLPGQSSVETWWEHRHHKPWMQMMDRIPQEFIKTQAHVQPSPPLNKLVSRALVEISWDSHGSNVSRYLHLGWVGRPRCERVMENRNRMT